MWFSPYESMKKYFILWFFFQCFRISKKLLSHKSKTWKYKQISLESFSIRTFYSCLFCQCIKTWLEEGLGGRGTNSNLTLEKIWKDCWNLTFFVWKFFVFRSYFFPPWINIIYIGVYVHLIFIAWVQVRDHTYYTTQYTEYWFKYGLPSKAQHTFFQVFS